jgi:hypothetical protein
MARVPVPNQPIESAAVQPGYQSDAAATAGAFGALQAQSLQRAAEPLKQLSGALGEEAIHAANRRDAISRARDLGVYTQQSQDALTNMTTGADMTDPATVAGYGKQLSDGIDKVVDAHTGGPESKEMLRARLELQRTQYLGHAQGLAADAQETLVKQTVATSLQPLTAEAYKNPGAIEDLMSRADANIADMAPGLGTVKAAALTQGARQEVLKSAIQGLLDSGRHEQAAKIVSENGALLTPETQRYFQSHITLAQVAADKAKNAVSALVSQATQTLGREPTMEEKRILLGLAKPADPNGKQYAPTPSETIAAFEKAAGRPATEEEKKIAFGLQKPPTDKPEKVYAPTPTETLDALRTTLGREPTEAEKLTVFGVNTKIDPTKKDKQYAPTPDETLKAFEAAIGKPATDEQKAAIFGAGQKVDPNKKEPQYAPTKEETIASFENAMGRKATDEEKATVFGLQKPVDPNKQDRPEKRTPEETIAAFEKVIGRTATPEEKATAFGLSKPATPVNPNAPGAFGNSLRGRALGIATDKAVGFANGLLSPEEERTFSAAVTQLQTPYTRVNPETGQPEQVTSPLPPDIIEAFRQRNMPLPAATGQPVTGAGAPTAAAPAPAGNTVAPTAAPAAASAAGGASPAPAGASFSPPPGGKTIWDLNKANLIAGPASALGELAYRTPAIGGMLPGEENTQARTYVELESRRLVQALQTNKNFAVKEMQSIEKDLDIRPSLHDSADAYKARLIGVDDHLAKLEQQALKQSDLSSGLPLETRKQARVSANLIHEFRNTLGVPQKMTPEQAANLPKGTPFRRTDNGEVMYAKGAKPQAGGE